MLIISFTFYHKIKFIFYKLLPLVYKNQRVLPCPRVFSPKVIHKIIFLNIFKKSKNYFLLIIKNF